MQYFVKFLLAIGIIGLPGWAVAEQFKVQPIVLNPASQDGPGAFRAVLGEDIEIRCEVTNEATGQSVSLTEVDQQFPEVRLRIRKARGGAGDLEQVRPGLGTYTPRNQDLHVFECRTGNAPADWAFQPMVLAIDLRTLDPSDVVAFFSRENGVDPVGRVGVGVPFELHVRAFSNLRTSEIPVSVSQVSWSRQRTPCEDTQPIFDSSVLRSAPPQSWVRGEGVVVPTEIREEGGFHACIRIPGGAGGAIIEKSISVRAVDDASPAVIEKFYIVESVGIGDIERDPPSSLGGPITEYEVRAIVRDDDPSALDVTFHNQSGAFDAIMTSRTNDRAVFEAHMPVSDGLQIVTARVSDGDTTSYSSTFSIAAEEFLTPLAQRQLDRRRHGQEFFLTLDVLEESPTQVFAPMSFEEAFNSLPQDERAGLFPGIVVTRKVADFGEGIPLFDGGYTIKARIELDAEDLHVRVERGERLKAGIRLEARIDIDFSCFHVVSGTETAVGCPITPTGIVDVDAEYFGPVEVVRDLGREAYLGLDWVNWTSNLDVHTEVSAPLLSFGWDSAAEALEEAINSQVLSELQKESIAGQLTGAGTLESFRRADGEWLGIQLTENQILDMPLSVSRFLAEGDVEGHIRSNVFQAELGGDFASLRMAGGFMPDDVRALTFFPRYARAMPDQSNVRWKSRDELLVRAPALIRQPVRDFAMMMHVDALNAHLAGLFAGGVADFDLPAPEFLELFVSDDIATEEEAERSRNASPFAALAHFPEGRVRLGFEHGPRLAPRDDMDSHLALEIGPLIFDIDLRPHNGSRLVLRAAAILAVEMGSINPHSGFSLDFPQDSQCRISDPGDGLNLCKTAFGFEVVEREEFTAHEVLPEVADHDEQIGLVAEWNTLRSTIGLAPVFATEQSVSREKQPGSLETFMRILFYSRKNPVDPNAEPFLPLTFELPPIALIGPIENAIGISLPREAKAGIRWLRFHPDVDPLGSDRGWIGLSGHTATIP